MHQCGDYRHHLSNLPLPGALLKERGDGWSAYGFLGAEYDQVSGLIYVGGRYYDPATGRLLSPDRRFDPYRPRTLNPYAPWLDPAARFLLLLRTIFLVSTLSSSPVYTSANL